MLNPRLISRWGLRTACGSGPRKGGLPGRLQAQVGRHAGLQQLGGVHAVVQLGLARVHEASADELS